MNRYLLPLLLGSCLLAGCSATGLVYDNLPWLLQNRIDARFDLTSAQNRELKAHLTEFAYWHRREELPRYAAALEYLELALADGLTPAELEEFVALFREARRRMLKEIIPPGSGMLLTLDREQIEEFDAAHREEMDEKRERMQRPREKRYKSRYRRTMRTLEDWFGEFDDSQSERIRELVNAFPDNSEGWYRRREFQHRRFLELIRSEPTRMQLETRLNRWWLTDDHELPEDMRELSRQFWQETVTFLLAVDGMLTERQRAHCMDKLRGYREDFMRLSKAVEPPPRRSSES